MECLRKKTLPCSTTVSNVMHTAVALTLQGGNEGPKGSRACLSSHDRLRLQAGGRPLTFSAALPGTVTTTALLRHGLCLLSPHHLQRYNSTPNNAKGMQGECCGRSQRGCECQWTHEPDPGPLPPPQSLACGFHLPSLCKKLAQGRGLEIMMWCWHHLHSTCDGTQLIYFYELSSC